MLKNFTKMTNTKLTTLLIYLFLFTNFTQAQITSSNPLGVASQSLASLTLPAYTVPLGSDRLLLVSVGADLPPATVTFDGTPMVAQGSNNNVWTLALGSNMASGVTGDIVFTVSGGTANFLGINAISFSGVDQTTPVDNYLEAQIPALSITSALTITSRVDDLVYDGVIAGCITGLCFSPPNATPNGGQVLQNNLSFPGTIFQGRGATSTTAGALSVPVGWTFSGSSISPLPGIHVGINIRKAVALPVELSSFSVRKQHDMVLVAWETQSETNNEGFDIERSTDGRTFEKIGNIKGAGSTSQSQQYEFMDKNPPEGILYFRLKQVDFDGAFEYSSVQTIKVKSTGFDIFPNPAIDKINIELPLQEEAIVRILDQTGKLVKIIEWKEGQQSIDISDLPKGVFIMEINVQNQLLVEKLIKL